MIELISKYRPQITEVLQEFFATKSTPPAYPWLTDVTEKLTSFSTSGKMIRGSIVPWIVECIINDKEKITAAIQAGAALELLQTSILIHDDIIDRDETRRGLSTIHTQYANHAQKHTWKDSTHHGNSLALCVGDIGYFWTFEILTSLSLPSKTVTTLTHYLGREFPTVGLAEMQDVAFAASTELPTEEEILKMYYGKTSLYTFIIPFQFGCIISEAPTPVHESLKKIGDTLGIIFQLHDDRLGLFGDPRKTGKPVGNDLREAKKTLYLTKLMTHATEQERIYISQIIGKKDAAEKDIHSLITLIQSKGITEEVDTYIQSLQASTKKDIDMLSEPKLKNGLSDLLTYIRTRSV